MTDLTSELRRMADDAAGQAQPVAVADVLSDGERRRRRTFGRRCAAGVAAAGGVAAVALAVTAAQPGHQPNAQLAAWTVTKHSDGDVVVAIRQFRDLAGLQSTLRADGVPASVLTGGQANICSDRNVPGGTVILVPRNVNHPSASPTHLTIHLSMLPTGTGVQIVTRPVGGPGSHTVSLHVVTASPRCTGR